MENILTKPVKDYERKNIFTIRPIQSNKKQMHEHKKHKLVPSIYGVIALISTYIHHTATKLHLISTPLIIYMFNFSLWPLGALFFPLYCKNVIGFKF